MQQQQMVIRGWCRSIARACGFSMPVDSFNKNRDGSLIYFLFINWISSILEKFPQLSSII